jgi:hypothetical protein
MASVAAVDQEVNISTPDFTRMEIHSHEMTAWRLSINFATSFMRRNRYLARMVRSLSLGPILPDGAQVRTLLDVCLGVRLPHGVPVNTFPCSISYRGRTTS